jgi:hypothetical protein
MELATRNIAWPLGHPMHKRAANDYRAVLQLAPAEVDENERWDRVIGAVCGATAIILLLLCVNALLA